MPPLNDSVNDIVPAPEKSIAAKVPVPASVEAVPATLSGAVKVLLALGMDAAVPEAVPDTFTGVNPPAVTVPCVAGVEVPRMFDPLAPALAAVFT